MKNKSLVTQQQKPKEIWWTSYERKSTEKGLEKEFNTLEAQKERCERHVNSFENPDEKWIRINKIYSDGGYSGGTLKRPALERLINDIKMGLIDAVVVYKVDRISRSLLDFANLMELFNQYNVAFISVTQHFNTSTPMGRFTLNILLSFAQFEREMASDRIKDKFEDSAKKGMWMGGNLPLGYDVQDRKLVIKHEEARIVHTIFEKFNEIGSVTDIVGILKDLGMDKTEFITKAGKVKTRNIANRGYIYKLLHNDVYAGNINHKGEVYPGQHKGIISQEFFDRTQDILKNNSVKKYCKSQTKHVSLLRGIMFCGGCESGMTPTHSKKKNKKYRYYIPNAFAKKKCTHCPVGSVASGDIEGIVAAKVKEILKHPDIILRTLEYTQQKSDEFSEDQIIKAFQKIEPVWDELFPVEKNRIVHLLIEKVVINPYGADISFRSDGIESIVNELQTKGEA